MAKPDCSSASSALAGDVGNYHHSRDGAAVRRWSYNGGGKIGKSESGGSAVRRRSSLSSSSYRPANDNAVVDGVTTKTKTTTKQQQEQQQQPCYDHPRTTTTTKKKHSSSSSSNDPPPRKRRLSTPSKSALRRGSGSGGSQGGRMNRRGSNDTGTTACSNSDHFELFNSNSNGGDHTAAATTTTGREQRRRKTVRFKTRLEKRKRILSRHHMTPSEHHGYWFQPYEYDAIERRNLRIIDKIEHSYEDNHGNIVVAFRHKHLRRYSNQYNTSSGSSNTKSSCLPGGGGTGTGTAQQQHDSQQQQSQPPRRRRRKRRPTIANCPRGLEKGLKNESRTSAAYKITALEAVAFEQDRQFRAGIVDDVAIADAYKKISRKCVFRARTRAVLDRKEVETYYHHHRNNDNNNSSNGDDHHRHCCCDEEEEDEDYDYDLGYNYRFTNRRQPPTAAPGRHNRLKAALARLLFAAPGNRYNGSGSGNNGFYDDSISALTPSLASSSHSWHRSDAATPPSYRGRPAKQYRSIGVR